jgi:N-acetylneuraminic acid mutarotase
LLSNGRVLVAGGPRGCDPNAEGGNPQLNSAEEYDPVSRSWVARTLTHTGRFAHTATLLSGGRVLIAGGVSETITTVTIEDDGEIFRSCSYGPPIGGAEVSASATTR